MSRVRIAHLSDPHFGTVPPGVQEGLIARLRELKPDLILLTGDITQRARRGQFRQAKDFTHALKPFPMIAVPGNHDIPLYNIAARLLFPYRPFRRLFKDLVEKDYVHDGVRVTGLNSTSRWRFVQGDFDLERIRRRIAAPYEGIKIRIAAFHHPMDCAKHVDDKNLLRGRDEAIRIFEEGEIDLVVGGHIHDPYVTLSDDRYPAVARRMVLSVAGTCLSWRTRADAPNSFNLIDVDAAGEPRMAVTRYDMSPDFNFSPREEHRFHRPTDGRGWRRGEAP